MSPRNPLFSVIPVGSLVHTFRFMNRKLKESRKKGIKMASENEENEGTSNEESVQLSFPLPPMKYYKQYTDANIKNDTAPNPPKLITGNYSMFGDAFDVSRNVSGTYFHAKPCPPTTILLESHTA